MVEHVTSMTRGPLARTNEKYKPFTVKSYKGPIELNATRRLWYKANNLNALENPLFNGKSYDTANGTFMVTGGAIRYFQTRLSDKQLSE